jgi:hypothetical protein
MYMGIRLATLALLAALTGCAAFDAPVYNVEHTQFKLTIRVDPNLPRNINGEAALLEFMGQKHCVITLRQYPMCLLHELRHCVEGHWHDPKVANSEDC